jgi:hypothetical protein
MNSSKKEGNQYVEWPQLEKNNLNYILWYFIKYSY